MNKIEKNIFKIIKKVRKEVNGSHSLKTYWCSKYCELFLIDNKRKNVISHAIIKNDGVFASNKNASQFIANIIYNYFDKEVDYNEI